MNFSKETLLVARTRITFCLSEKDQTGVDFFDGNCAHPYRAISFLFFSCCAAISSADLFFSAGAGAGTGGADDLASFLEEFVSLVEA